MNIGKMILAWFAAAIALLVLISVLTGFVWPYITDNLPIYLIVPIACAIGCAVASLITFIAGDRNEHDSKETDSPVAKD
jgi:hypothetical protein